MKKLSHEQIGTRRIKIDNLRDAQRIPVRVLVDNVRSLYNVGSIFRTSDAAMIEQLILTGFTPRPPRREIEKTALGSTRSVPWTYIKSPIEAIDQLKSDGVTICCLEQTDSSIRYTELPRSAFPLCLVIGNEITGISGEILARSDLAVEIPMHGTKHSLNVAVAYGIAVYSFGELWRASSGG